MLVLIIVGTQIGRMCGVAVRVHTSHHCGLGFITRLDIMQVVCWLIPLLQGVFCRCSGFASIKIQIPI
jgi:hypothetical protein